MKKLMIALVAVAVAAGVQAASFTWSATGDDWQGNFYTAAGTDLTTATVYLFDAATISQDGLLQGIKNGAKIDSYANAEVASISGGTFATTPVEYGEIGGSYNFFMAALVGEELLISELQSGLGQDGKSPDLAFSNPGVWSDGLYGTGNHLSETSFSTAGWYDAAAVPEPTSGLLLLLGVAGLALRRRRA